MATVALPNQLRIPGLYDHKLALRWLALLYCSPRQFLSATERLTPMRKVRLGLVMWAQALPYLIAVAVSGRVCLLQLSGANLTGRNPALDLVVGIGFGACSGIGWGVIAGTVAGTATGLAYGR